MARWDVAVAGLGPTGCVLALLLAAEGLRVVAADPAVEPFPHPRAVAVDDDVLRVLHRFVDPPLSSWQRAAFVSRGELLLDVGFGETEVGEPALAFLHQPTLERLLRVALVDAGVEVRLGTRMSRDEDATWLVACDGANSSLRQALGIGFPQRGRSERWLVVDAEVDAPLTELPYFQYVCDPSRPAVTMPFPGGHRWEWRLQPGETLDPAPLLPAGARVVRAAEYAFAARLAERWRDGRVLLAGDAAHTMPPFAGQGMAAGIRDAAQLAWRLAELVRGTPREPDPLAAWERERRAHVRQVVLLSRFLGRLVGTPHAGARDALLRGLNATPGLGRWLREGGPRPPSGPRLPSPRVRALDGSVTRLDDVLPWAWARLSLAPETGAVTVVPRGGRRATADPAALEDLDGTLVALLRRRGGSVTVRPDRLLT